MKIFLFLMQRGYFYKNFILILVKIKIIFNENENVYFMKYFNFFNEHDF